MSVIFKNRVPITSRNTEPPPRWRYQVARQIKTLSFSIIGLSTLLSVGNVSAGTDKVTICHKSKDTLTISKSALKAHLAHGDTMGACETDGTLSAQPTPQPPSDLTVVPQSWNFGSVKIGNSSAERTFLLFNGTASLLQLGVIDEFANITTTTDEFGTVTTAYSDEFGNIATGDGCSNTEIGGTSPWCLFTMVFEPEDPAGTKELDLFIPYEDEFGNSNTLTLPLNGISMPEETPPLTPENCASQATKTSSGPGFWSIVVGPITDSDVVLIDHVVTHVPPAIDVRALCVTSNGELQGTPSQNFCTTGSPVDGISVYAGELISNKGTIQTAIPEGIDDNTPIPPTTPPYDPDSGAHSSSTYCYDSGISFVDEGQNGGDILLEVLTGQISNDGGTIKASNGGAGYLEGGHGGSVTMYAQDINSIDGEIKAGHGREGNAHQPSWDGFWSTSDYGNKDVSGGDGGDVFIQAFHSLFVDDTNVDSGNGGQAGVWCSGDGCWLSNWNNDDPRWPTGTCNCPSGVTIATPTPGAGGDWTMTGPFFSFSGTGTAGGTVYFEPELMLSEPDMRISGENVVIFGGDDWVMKLDNLSENAISATFDITLAVGENGVIDLRGNTSTVLKAGGQVQIFSDTILLEPGVTLEDVIEAEGGIEVHPSKIIYRATLKSGKKWMTGKPGVMLPIDLILSNIGPKEDTYTLTVSDSEGWNKTALPSPITVQGLQHKTFGLGVILPSTVGATTVISVTATSQNDPSVVTTTKVRITVIAEDSNISVEIGETTLGGGSEPCPSTGVISGMCDNRGRSITDVTLESSASVTGGSIFGNIDSKGMISQATIGAGAILRGGKLSGNVTTRGELADFDFVGGELVCEDECKLSGTITNSSRVGGHFINPHFAADASMTGGLIKGRIFGEPGAPARLTNVEIGKGSQLRNVIIGDNVQLPDDVEWGKGVRFTHHEQIPDMELIDFLPTLLAAACELTGVDYPKCADFTADVHDPSDGILSAINDLPLFKDNGWILLQNSETGVFELTVEIDDLNIRAGLLPTSLKKTMATVDFEVGIAESIHFFTETDLDVLTQPALQAPIALQSILSALEIPEFTVQTNGNVRVPSGVEGLWFPIRPNWWTLQIDADAETGVSIIDSPYISVLLSMVFADNEGNKREQLLYPAVGYPELLYASAEEVSIGPYGVVDFEFEDQRYCGVMHYVVQPSTESGDTLKIESLSDLTGNGMDDFVLIYPNDEEQWMFSISCE